MENKYVLVEWLGSNISRAIPLMDKFMAKIPASLENTERTKHFMECKRLSIFYTRKQHAFLSQAIIQ